MSLLAVTKRWIGGSLPSMTAAKTWVSQLAWRKCLICKSQRHLQFWYASGLVLRPQWHRQRWQAANSWPGSQRKKEDNMVLLPPLKVCPLTQAPHCTASQGHTCGPGLCLRPKLVHTAGGVLLEEHSSCSTPFLRHHSHLCLCTALCSCAPNSPQSLWVLREQYSCALLMLKRNQSEPSTHSPLRWQLFTLHLLHEGNQVSMGFDCLCKTHLDPLLSPWSTIKLGSKGGVSPGIEKRLYLNLNSFLIYSKQRATQTENQVSGSEIWVPFWS